MNFIESAIKANQEIYNLLQKGMREEYFKKHQIGAGGDVSRGVDIIAENIFIKHLSKFGEIDSEEIGRVGEGESRIIIDPIDGSSNFISQFPYYGSSVALLKDNSVKVGIVANFANGDIFIKDRESFRVAKLNKLNFEEVKINPHSTIAIFERGYKENKYENIFRRYKIKYRVPGAIALSLAYARYVDFIFFENLLRDYDIMAGMFMCEDLYQTEIDKFYLICNNRERFENLKEILKG